ncbi:uncharacterized protein METZ01_LOCUS397289, partial [marine metagenome]
LPVRGGSGIPSGNDDRTNLIGYFPSHSSPIPNHGDVYDLQCCWAFILRIFSSGKIKNKMKDCILIILIFSTLSSEIPQFIKGMDYISLIK